MARRVIEAKQTAVLMLQPTAPFHFDGTVHKPSHFPTADVHHEPGIYWQTRPLLGEHLVHLAGAIFWTGAGPQPSRRTTRRPAR